MGRGAVSERQRLSQVVLVSPHHSGLHLAGLRPLHPFMVEVGYGHIQQGEGYLLEGEGYLLDDMGNEQSGQQEK